jgi:hypothetical protein
MKIKWTRNYELYADVRYYFNNTYYLTTEANSWHIVGGLGT